VAVHWHATHFTHFIQKHCALCRDVTSFDWVHCQILMTSNWILMEPLQTHKTAFSRSKFEGVVSPLDVRMDLNFVV
jgi:hypothetical protein